MGEVTRLTLVEEKAMNLHLNTANECAQTSQHTKRGGEKILNQKEEKERKGVGGDSKE